MEGVDRLFTRDRVRRLAASFQYDRFFYRPIAAGVWLESNGNQLRNHHIRHVGGVLSAGIRLARRSFRRSVGGLGFACNFCTGLRLVCDHAERALGFLSFMGADWAIWYRLDSGHLVPSD